MLSILALGFLIGLQHALEADHVAAVVSLATRSRSALSAARQGAVWGIGHTLTLFLFGGAVLLAEGVVPGEMAAALEMAVGVMLVLLGLDVLRRLLKERIHFHVHRHGAETHFHAHRHQTGIDHARDPHQHRHEKTFPLRALLVGMMHGMAGSAALIVLALGSVQSPWQGLLYILLFGLGSVAGMAVLAAVISLPLHFSARGFTWAHNGIKASVGIFTAGLGTLVLYQAGVAFL